MRPGDVASLAQLASDAFRGSADGDWSLEQYVDDMEATLAGRFGAFLAEAGALVATPTRTLGAVLFTHEHGLPSMPYCLTDPLAQRQGLATHLITRAGHILLRDGHRQLQLAVLETNPAVALYARLGFRRLPEP